MSVSDPYKVLQVDPEAEHEVIAAAYRRLARKYHPDVSPGRESHERMIAINQAWEVLKDPVKRAAHDRARVRDQSVAAWVAATDAKVRTAGGRGPAVAQTPVQPAPSRPAPPSSFVAGKAADPTWPLGMADPAQATQPSPAGTQAARTWSTGRVPIGGLTSGAASRPDGEGAAGPPPGNPSGSILTFGRFAGWSLGEVARTEIEYLEWLDRMPIGRTYQQEIDELLRARGLRSGPMDANQGRGGPFRRR